MACRRHLAIVVAACLLADALCVPAHYARPKRGAMDNEIHSSKEMAGSSAVDVSISPSGADSTSTTTEIKIDSFEDEDDDEVFSEPMQTAPTGGSSIFSLLRLAGALFPGSSGAAPLLGYLMKEALGYNPIRGITQNFGLQGLGVNQRPLLLRRQDIGDNEIEIDYIQDLKPPPLQRQETDEESDSSESNEEANDDDDDDNAAEASVENTSGGNNNEKASDQDDAESNGDDDYDSDEPPEGDGQGGGILGLLAGLSGGEDGQSDLGSLLATVSGIVANLSGDGIDLNALIASGIGLFVGLLSEGEENPGSVIASYLLTSLDTITGGGAQNNGAFFGNLVSKLVKGTSAAEPAGAAPQMQQSSPLWTLKMDILRAILQFGTSVIGMASSASTNAITV